MSIVTIKYEPVYVKTMQLVKHALGAGIFQVRVSLAAAPLFSNLRTMSVISLLRMPTIVYKLVALVLGWICLHVSNRCVSFNKQLFSVN